MMDILSLIIGVVLGAIIGYLLGSRGSSGGDQEAQIIQLSEDKSRAEGLLDQFKSTIEKNQLELDNLRKENQTLIQSNAEHKSSIHHLKENLDSQEQNLIELQKKFTLQFENMANRIFEEKTRKFTAQNKENLGQLLTPFSERIKTFEEAVKSNQLESTKERTSLTEQIKHLTDLNQKMRSDAQNLTKALKGDNKTQGNWGEFILERILEESGLVNGQEYFTQHTDQNDQGSTVRPDVVINLPEKKHLIIDSKVSLVAYEQYVSSDDDEYKAKALKLHLESLKSHIKGLSEKNYHSSKSLDSPEFVLLFIPIESSFSIAIQADNELYKYAWEKKVVIVSPSTLLATLRTIASVWKQERQTKNAIEIARQAGKLYDKFVGFIADMKKIKQRLEQGNEAYDAAMNKLSSGSGNLIVSTEKLKKLGAKASKALPEDIVENSDSNEEE